MRGLCSSARITLVLAAALIVSSCSDVADGVRSTPNHADASGSADAARRLLDGSSTANDDTNQATLPRDDDGSKLAAEDERDTPLAARRQRATASGSRLPDCAHACGACSPCRRVMVSFMCAETASESCPVAYRCMCRGRFFRVPSF